MSRSCGAAAGELQPIVCTPEEERIFSTLLAAVRHFCACPDTHALLAS